MWFESSRSAAPKSAVAMPARKRLGSKAWRGNAWLCFYDILKASKNWCLSNQWLDWIFRWIRMEWERRSHPVDATWSVEIHGNVIYRDSILIIAYKWIGFGALFHSPTRNHGVRRSVMAAVTLRKIWLPTRARTWDMGINSLGLIGWSTIKPSSTNKGRADAQKKGICQSHFGWKTLVDIWCHVFPH